MQWVCMLGGKGSDVYLLSPLQSLLGRVRSQGETERGREVDGVSLYPPHHPIRHDTPSPPLPPLCHPPSIIFLHLYPAISTIIITTLCVTLSAIFFFPPAHSVSMLLLLRISTLPFTLSLLCSISWTSLCLSFILFLTLLHWSSWECYCFPNRSKFYFKAFSCVCINGFIILYHSSTILLMTLFLFFFTWISFPYLIYLNYYTHSCVL